MWAGCEGVNECLLSLNPMCLPSGDRSVNLRPLREVLIGLLLVSLDPAPERS
jgi:hypothetical protein